MVDESPALGGDSKPDANNNNTNKRGGSNRKFKKNRNANSHHEEKFTGQIPDLATFRTYQNSRESAAAFAKSKASIVAYAARNLGSQAAKSIEKGKLILPTEPVADEYLTEQSTKDGGKKRVLTETGKVRYQNDYQQWTKKKDTVHEHLRQLFQVVMGQCDENVKAALNDDPDFDAIDDDMDVIKLFKMIESLAFKGKATSDPFYALTTVMLELISLKQHDLSLTEYYERFVATGKAADELYGGEGRFLAGHRQTFIETICAEEKEDINNLTSDKKREYAKQGRERMEAMRFLLNADRKRFGEMVDQLHQDFLKGNASYPRSLSSAYALLRSVKVKNPVKHRIPDELGHQFNVNGDEDEAASSNTSGKARVVCQRCGKPGHATSKCFATKHNDGHLLHTMGQTTEDYVNANIEVVEGDEPDDVAVSDQTAEAVILCSVNQTEELIFHQSESPSTSSNRNGIPDTWILLDSQSSIDVFCNGKLLTRIYKSASTLTIRCNAGVRQTNLRGYLSGYGWVWYYPDGIANILSLSRVKEQFRVVYDSTAGNCFQVHKTNGEILNFTEGPKRLYFFDTANRNTEQTLLINTVEDNLKLFSAYDVDKAKKARKLQQVIGRPSTADFKRYIAENLIPNCPVTVQDVNNAEFIWGPDITSLQGKTVRRKPRQISVVPTTIPPHIMEHYRNVTLSVDIMKVTGLPFLMSVSKHIKFGSAGMLRDMKNETILKHFKAIIGAYAIRGFKVTIVLADNQFESLRGDIADLQVHLHVVARDEHVPEIERFIRVIKERVRCNWSAMPFKWLPPVMIAELVYSAVFWRNMFPLQHGISTTQSPGEIVLNRKIDYNTHCRVELFQYAQTHEEHDNSMAPRTVGAIATRPTGNGSYYFVSLQTGRVLNRREFTCLPMPQGAIDRMHHLARRARAATALTFTNRDNIDLDTLYADLERDGDDLPLEALTAGVNDDGDEDDDSEDYEPSDEESESDSDDDDDDDDDDDVSADGENAGVEATAAQDAPAANDTDDDEEESPGVDTNNVESEDNNAVESSGVTEEPNVEPIVEEPTGLRRSERSRRMSTKYPESEYVHTTVSTGKVNVMNPRMFSNAAVNKVIGRVRPHDTVKTTKITCNVFTTCGDELQKDDQILLLNINATNDNGYDETIMAQTDAEWLFLTEHLGWGEGLQGEQHDIAQDAEYLFTTEQMNWKKGLKIFGDRGEDAIQKELQQIHDMEGFQPKHWYELTKEERADALKYLMYLKEKRDGRIKGRGCADGRKQRAYIPKAEASSPTATLQGIMLTCMIDAYEKRDVATVDIPGAFLQTKMPKEDRDVHVVLDGRMAELLAKISPGDYQKFVHNHRGQSHIYCKLNVSLYGTLKAAVLFWKKLSGYLKDQGFTVNPYDWCVANKDINGKQCTIVWHVDDLKISHVDTSVVDEIVRNLRSEFGKVGDLTVHRGKVHDYLGMELDFSEDGNVMVSMEKYLDEILIELPEDMDGTAVTPAAEHLFKTRDNAPKLDNERAALFHRVTAQLLFASQRARPDLRTVVSFLTKRVQTPDEDDYKKLARAIKYVRRTKYLRLKIEAHRLDQNHWFIDGAFAVHQDMKSHTGAYMTFGKGMVNGTSSAQKINTTSSTEAEVVAVHDNMPAILWTRYFMEGQGYPLKPTVVHQDNQSAMLLETNGKGSSGKRTRHMNIRYFFVADVQERKQIILEYCPTDEMIGDFFTKPLQGAKFRRFRNIIMNITHDEYGPVDIDELMKLHHERMQKRNDSGEIEYDSKDNQREVQPSMESQECVGDKIQGTVKTVSWSDVVRGRQVALSEPQK